MKHLILLTSLLSLFFSAGAQILESEPNDPQALGNTLPINTVVTGQTCMWNEPDFFKIEMPDDGILTIHTSIAGSGENPSTLLHFQLFNPSGAAWNAYTPAAGNNGQFLDEDNQWCCLKAGTYYIQVYSDYAFNYCYDYTLSWDILNAAYANDIESNSSYQDALFLEYNTAADGHLSFYADPQGAGQDGTDFYAFVAPTNGTVRLFIETQAHSTGSNTLNVNIHTINGAAWYGQYTPVGIYPAVNVDTLQWSCVNNDTLYFSLNTTNFYDRGYAYRIRYDLVPEHFSNDVEPNNFFPQAQLVDPGLPIEGNQLHGYSGLWAGTSEDVFKFYKPYEGSLKIIATSTTQGSDGTGGHTVQLFDHNTNPIGSPLNAPLGVYDQLAVDSITFNSLAADTFYIKTYSTYAYATCRSYRLDLEIEIPESISEQGDDNIQIYPNPSKGEFNLVTSNMSGYAQLALIDIAGREVFNEWVVLGSNHSVHPGNLPSGYYTLLIKQKGTALHKKVVIE